MIGAIVAVNLIIYSGIDRGYEASLGDVFNENWLVGMVAVVVLLGGPALGIVVARRRRRNRGPSASGR